MEELPASLQKVLFYTGSYSTEKIKNDQRREKIPQTQIRVQKSHFLLWFGECIGYEKTNFKSEIKNCLTLCVKSLASLPM